MSVLPHEGTHPILYGTLTVPANTRVHSAYMARPDLAGSYPSLALAPDASGVTPGMKDLCRRVARRGVAVVAAPQQGDEGARVRTLRDVLAFLRRPGTEWADPRRVSLGGIGEGAAAAAASLDEDVHRFVMAYPDISNQALERVTMPALVLLAKDDPDLLQDAVRVLKASLPSAQLVIYADTAPGFLDIGGEAYDDGAADDAMRRLAEFLVASRDDVGVG